MGGAEGGAHQAQIMFYLFRRILIDTGEPDRPDYVKLLRKTLTQSKAAISEVLITHWHLDHTGGLPSIASLVEGKSDTQCKSVLCTHTHTHATHFQT